MKSCLALIAIAVVSLTAVAPAQERTRESVGEQYKWNLSDLYPSDATRGFPRSRD